MRLFAARHRRSSVPEGLAALACAVFAVSLAGCKSVEQPRQPAESLHPSPRLIVGRVLAVDPELRFAFVDLASDAPNAALVNGTELITRTLDLRETGRIRSSPYLRGRTLGTKIVGGQPSAGDEVVWLAP